MGHACVCPLHGDEVSGALRRTADRVEKRALDVYAIPGDAEAKKGTTIDVRANVIPLDKLASTYRSRPSPLLPEMRLRAPGRSRRWYPHRRTQCRSPVLATAWVPVSRCRCSCPRSEWKLPPMPAPSLPEMTLRLRAVVPPGSGHRPRLRSHPIRWARRRVPVGIGTDEVTLDDIPRRGTSAGIVANAVPWLLPEIRLPAFDGPADRDVGHASKLDSVLRPGGQET